ncbi:hypothetical protein RFI_17840 [Reticulomyxa filosa]|uniref:Uncharacterized protein n=1 Tax=Reticulomyxa filosa TaxID=46433 RepID=X6N109_RETFI|nr:hypothetical protein RFI_17840 [Reticulomyxa filosa]|eukprot:ETO19389.1 hypothetical protein RFI_17840 [Reticulomyxa filosa]
MYGLKYNVLGGILQFLDVMLFVEVYASLQGVRTKSTLQLRWIRRMEAVLESAPQSFLQLIFLLRTKVIHSFLYFYVFMYFMICMLFLLSIANSVVKSDDWNFKIDANKKCPPHPSFLVRGTFRLAEVVSRLLIVALLTQTAHIGFTITLGIFVAYIHCTGHVVCVFLALFYLIMYRDGFLGHDIGNVAEVLIVHPNLSLRLDDENAVEHFFLLVYEKCKLHLYTNKTYMYA